jgi:hypothetical protein
MLSELGLIPVRNISSGSSEFDLLLAGSFPPHIICPAAPVQSWPTRLLPSAKPLAGAFVSWRMSEPLSSLQTKWVQLLVSDADDVSPGAVATRLKVLAKHGRCRDAYGSA